MMTILSMNQRTKAFVNCDWNREICTYTLPNLTSTFAPYFHSEKPAIDCEKCQSLAVMRMVAGLKVNIPECDEDNTFKAKQCWKEECWCVKKDGEIIPDTKKNASEPLNCIAERGRYSAKAHSAAT